MILPKDSETFNAPIAQTLFARKEAGEFSVTLMHDEGWTARVEGHDLPEFVIELDTTGAGVWNDGGRASGRAILPTAP